MLSKNEIKHYHSNGYVFPNISIPNTDLIDIRKKHSRLIKCFPEYRDNFPDLLSYDKSFLKYANNPQILDIVSQLIGPNIALWNMSFFAKPAKNGKKTPWHQDGQYWPIKPLATCTVWIAIDDASVKNGCMRFIPGSHKTRQLYEHEQKSDDMLTLQQELKPHAFDQSNAINVELTAGKISLHDVYLFHGSDVNQSNKPRRGMTLRLMPTTSYYDRIYAKDLYQQRGDYNGAKRQLYLLRGIDACGRNNFKDLKY